MKRFLIPVALLCAASACLAATCDEGGEGGTTPPQGGGAVVDAPIDELDVIILESFPVQYNLHIVSGLPSGCADFDKAEVTERSGTEISVRVTNTLPDDPNVACTAIYGIKETTLHLGSDFTSGETYTVNVNDKSVEFTAQ